MTTTSRRSRRYLPSTLPLRLDRLEDRNNPGTGTFTSGTFNFCVSIRFNATPAQIAQIETAFQNASQILADATDGQHRFGTIGIVNNGGAADNAEFWINPGGGRAYATLGKYGVRGEHVNLFFDDNFLAKNGADGDAYTIAHEMVHHAYGIADEYSGPGGNAYNAPPSLESPTLNYSLMDNYFTRGGRAGGGTTYTLNELSVASDHDPDKVTWQTAINHMSDWGTVATSRFPAIPPTDLPVSAPPPFAPVTFVLGNGATAAMVVIDQSGSMEGDRLGYAVSGGQTFTYYLGSTDKLGVASFADSGTLDFALATATDAVKAAARGVISNLTAGGSTNITAGLQAALDQLNAPGQQSCNETIILLTDGDHNTGPGPETLIPALKKAGVSVLAIGVGSGISTDGQALLQRLASETGGQYFQIADDFSQVGLLFRTSMQSVGNGLTGSSPEMSIAPGQSLQSSSVVEQGALSAVFALARSDATGTVDFHLVGPSGQVLTASSPGVTVVNDGNLESLTVANPEAGQWQMVADGASGVNTVQFLSAVNHPGTSLLVSVDSGSVAYPNPILVRATPQYNGQNVLGATVTGTVTRPDGSKVGITLFDDGSAEHGDQIAGDGVYSARFAQYAGGGAGTYTFDLTAVNVNGRTYDGEQLYASAGAPSASVSAPAFTRFATTSAVVTGAPTSLPDTMRRVVVGADAGGAPVISVRDSAGTEVDTLTVFDSGFTGGVRTASGDFNGDGVLDYAVGTGPGVVTQVKVLDGKTHAVLFTAQPFESAFTGGVYLAAGDITGDGVPELVVTPDQGGGPVVVVYRGTSIAAGQSADAAQLIRFLGIDDPNFRGGARAAVGDMNGDGLGEIIVSAGFLGGPRITIWDGRSIVSGQPAQSANFFAFEDTLRNGAFLAAGDFTGDGKADVAFGGGPGGGPRVRVFDGAKLLSSPPFQNVDEIPAAQTNNFFAGDSTNRGGIRLTAKPLDTDSRADLIAGAGENAGAQVTVYNGTSLAAAADPTKDLDFLGFENFAGGVFVG
jgi:hypothetical protein